MQELFYNTGQYGKETEKRLKEQYVLRAELRRSIQKAEIAHEKALSSFSFDWTLPLNLYPVVRFELDESLLIIEIIKSKVPLEKIQTKFYVTNKGMIGSLRKDIDGDVKIGRQQMTDDGYRPNDIILNPEDTAISRSHCRLIYKNGLFSSSSIGRTFIHFLFMSHPRLGRYSYGRHIPLSIYRHIFSYLKPRRVFLIQDLGSIYGTYIRVKSPRKISRSCSILIAPEISVNILGAYNSGMEYLLQSKGGMKNANDGETNLQSLIKKLFRGFDMHLIPSQTEKVESWRLLASPLMLLSISYQDPCLAMQHHGKHALIPVGKNGRLELLIGPQPQFSDIFVQDAKSTIKIIYDDGAWYLEEAKHDNYCDEDELSLDDDFGTWISVSECKSEGQSRFVQNTSEIFNGDEIKISETVMKISWTFGK